MFSKKSFFFIFFLLSVISFSQTLRRSSVAAAAGYVRGENHFQYAPEQSANQAFVWANYATSALHSFSAIYRKYGLAKNENLKSYLAGITTTLNFFPWYFSASFVRSNYNSINDEIVAEKLPSYNNIFSFSATYYHRLFFYTLKGNYISQNFEKGVKNKIFFALAQITWRPSMQFFADVEGGITYDKNNNEKFFTYNFSLNWRPVNFAMLSFRRMLGERKFYYDADFMIYYDMPFIEKEAEVFYLTITPIKNLDLVFNFENREYDKARSRYYSVSAKFVF